MKEYDVPLSILIGFVRCIHLPVESFNIVISNQVIFLYVVPSNQKQQRASSVKRGKEKLIFLNLNNILKLFRA